MATKVLDAYVQLSAKGVEGVGAGLNKVETGARSAYGALANIAQITAGNALASGVTRLAGAIASVPQMMLKANSEFETTKVGFEVLLGSMDAAEARIEELTKFAAETPFEMPGISKASKQLEMAKAPAEDHMRLLRMTGDAASAANVNIDELGMWVSRTYSAIQAGRPWGEAAMRMQELGILSGDARDKLERMTETGVNSKEVWAAFEKEMGRFSGMTQKQAQTAAGLTSTIKDNMMIGLRTMSEPLFNAFKGVLGSIVGAMSGDEFIEGAKNLGLTIVDGFRQVGQFVAPIVQDVMTLGQSIYDLVGGVEIVDTLGGAFQQAGEFGAAMWELTLAGLNAFVEMTAVVWEAIDSAIVAGFNAIGVGASSTAGLVSSAFSVIVEWISYAASMLRNWDLVFEIIAVYIMNFGENFVSALGTIGENIGIVFNNFQTVVTGVAGAVWAIIQNLAHNIGEAFKHAWSYLTGEEVEVNYRGIMDGVDEALKDMPKFAEFQLQSATERYGDVLDDIGNRWGERELERQKQIEARKKQIDKGIADATGVESNKLAENNKPLISPNTSPTQEQLDAEADKGKYGKKGKKEDTGSLLDIASFWEKLQKSAMGTKTPAEDAAENQRKDQLAEAKKTNENLKGIRENTEKPQAGVFG